MARILLVGGGCRGRALASALAAEGHALRITTRSQAQRPLIEAAGAECWLGTPARLATLRGALEGVTIACWLLAAARGPAAELTELHGSRLQFFLTQLIDTPVRGLVYEAGRFPAAARASTAPAAARASTAPAAAGASAPAELDAQSTPASALEAGEELVRRVTRYNAIPVEVLRAPAEPPSEWVGAARAAIARLLDRA